MNKPNMDQLAAAQRPTPEGEWRKALLRTASSPSATFIQTAMNFLPPCSASAILSSSQRTVRQSSQPVRTMGGHQHRLVYPAESATALIP